jgi:hypothetical protein
MLVMGNVFTSTASDFLSLDNVARLTVSDNTATILGASFANVIKVGATVASTTGTQEVATVANNTVRATSGSTSIDVADYERVSVIGNTLEAVFLGLGAHSSQISVQSSISELSSANIIGNSLRHFGGALTSSLAEVTTANYANVTVASNVIRATDGGVANSSVIDVVSNGAIAVTGNTIWSSGGVNVTLGGSCRSTFSGNSARSNGGNCLVTIATNSAAASGNNLLEVGTGQCILNMESSNRKAAAGNVLRGNSATANDVRINLAATAGVQGIAMSNIVENMGAGSPGVVTAGIVGNQTL